MKQKRYEAYRDGLSLFTEGEVIDTPEATVEVLFSEKTGDEKVYFAEIKGTTLCAHGDSIEEAINEALSKGAPREITDEEKATYRDPNFRFSTYLFRRLTGACRVGVNEWLKQKGLSKDITMTLAEFKKVGPGDWIFALEDAISD